MSESVKPSRAAAYPRRHLRAQATRARILESARVLFIERGYVATTMEAIASDADVAPETIYAVFGTKRAVLAGVVDIAISGDVEAAPVMAQAWVQALRDEPDAHRRVRILARNGRTILERRHAIDEVVRSASASDPGIAALYEIGKTQRYAGQRELLRIVVGEARLRPGVDLETAADALYALGSPETFRSLVVDRGWDGDRFEQWYGEALDRLLFEDRPG